MDPETVRKAVAPELVNAMNYPDRVRPYILGQDMGPLIDRVVNAVVNAEPVPLRKFDSDGHEVAPYYLRAVVAEGKLARIRALHTEGDVPDNGFNTVFEFKWCELDHEPWPCTTVKILDAVSVDATPQES